MNVIITVKCKVILIYINTASASINCNICRFDGVKASERDYIYFPALTVRRVLFCCFECFRASLPCCSADAGAEQKNIFRPAVVSDMDRIIYKLILLYADIECNGVIIKLLPLVMCCYMLLYPAECTWKC